MCCNTCRSLNITDDIFLSDVGIQHLLDRDQGFHGGLPGEQVVTQEHFAVPRLGQPDVHAAWGLVEAHFLWNVLIGF